MQIYSDMKFSGSAQELRALLDQLDTLGKVGEWTRDREAEKEIEGLTSRGQAVRCFKSVSSEDLPESRLWLDINQTEWSVTNIVPAGPGSIDPPMYSALLSSFRMAVLPLVVASSVIVSEPAYEVGPEHWLTPTALMLLRQFSGNANKSTGAGHPLDRARWNKFVIATHREQCKLDGGDLSQILIEVGQWPEAKAGELSNLFEYERSLLKDYDELA